MNGDLISRSRLLRDPYFREDRYPISHHLRMAIMEQPAIDPEELFKHLIWVKEALEMAKQTVAPVVRCKDCEWFHPGPVDYCCRKHTGLAKAAPDSFCSYGKRRAAPKKEAADCASEEVDLEHMTRFAMQKAFQNK